jgi:hypothetical protein
MNEPNEKPSFPVFTAADRFKKARKETGLGIAAFAKFAQISIKQVQNAETQGAVVPENIFIIWAFRTNVVFEWLWSGEGEIQSP